MSPRTRDPARREKILAAATKLLAGNGFHSVSMADIGNLAGITGSGIYRHFQSKGDILVVLFEQVIDGLLEDGRLIAESTTDLNLALSKVVDGQVDFVVKKRQLARIYHHEINNLPEDDQVRLRRKQRLYIEEWVHLLRELNPGLEEHVARTLTHAAISAIQSALFHRVNMPEEEFSDLLRQSAHAILGISARRESKAEAV